MCAKLFSEFPIEPGTGRYAGSIIVITMAIHYCNHSVDSVVELNSQPTTKYQSNRHAIIRSRTTPPKHSILKGVVCSLVGLLVLYSTGGCATQGTRSKYQTTESESVEKIWMPDREPTETYIIRKAGPPKWDLAGRLKRALDPPKKSEE